MTENSKSVVVIEETGNRNREPIVAPDTSLAENNSMPKKPGIGRS